MIKLKIYGMRCSHCIQTVTNILAAVPGVTQPPSINLTSGIAEIAGEPKINELLAALKSIGYFAEVHE